MSGFAQGLLGALLRDTHLVTPQLFLITVATLMLWPGDLFFNRNEKHKWAPITLVILAVTAVLVARTTDGEGFSRMFRMDGLTRGFQMLCVVATAGTVLLSMRLLDSLKQQTVEYYALILFSLSGMLFLCGASDLISVYFSIELMAICIYILVAYLRDRATSVEAGMKYFLLGAFSSGILVYGISLLYGASGGVTTNLADLNQALALTPTSSNLLVYTGVLMVLVGMAFKVAAVPFHMWAPDAYEGAPTPITAFMATAPKAAAMAAFLRVFGSGFHGRGEHDPGQRGRGEAGKHEAPAGLLQHRARGLHAPGRTVGRSEGRGPGGLALHAHLHRDEHRRLRRGDLPPGQG
jgi:NADH-quinone oxidoreductase subunit N